MVSALRTALRIKFNFTDPERTKDKNIAFVLHVTPSNFSRIASGVQIVSPEVMRKLLVMVRAYAGSEVLFSLFNDWLSSLPAEDAEFKERVRSEFNLLFD